jgi:two-component system sensor histidine kinase KdpD
MEVLRGRRFGRRRPSVEAGAVGIAALTASTVVAAVLESGAGVADASSVYLLAVVVMAFRYGLWPAVATSLLSVVVYDLLFTAPRLTLTVADPQEWLSLLLFLVVAVVIARLAALQAERAADATRRADEARTLFGISRSLATAVSVQLAAREIVERLQAGAGMESAWIALGNNPSNERVLAGAVAGRARAPAAVHWTLHRSASDAGDQWVRTHTGRQPGRAGDPSRAAGESAASRAPGEPLPVAGEESRTEVGAQTETSDMYRVGMEAEDQRFGSVWGVRAHGQGVPGPAETRLLSLAADQIALALRREQLASEATKAEVARRSDTLKTALLDSVSHGFRTPLATIRALAGQLIDEETTTSPQATRQAAGAIDQEAARLSDVVRNVLDLGRIEGDALKAELEVHELAEIVRGVVRREKAIVDPSRVDIDLSDGLPPVLVDAVFLDQSLTNVLENAAAYAGPGASIRVSARPGDDGFVDLLVDDSGPGVPDQDLDRLFEKFYRRATLRSARAGLGIGLSVARGLVEAMGGRLSAERSGLGGLAIRFRLPRARVTRASLEVEDRRAPVGVGRGERAAPGDSPPA